MLEVKKQMEHREAARLLEEIDKADREGRDAVVDEAFAKLRSSAPKTLVSDIVERLRAAAARRNPIGVDDWMWALFAIAGAEGLPIVFEHTPYGRAYDQALGSEIGTDVAPYVSYFEAGLTDAASRDRRLGAAQIAWRVGRSAAVPLREALLGATNDVDASVRAMVVRALSWVARENEAVATRIRALSNDEDALVLDAVARALNELEDGGGAAVHLRVLEKGSEMQQREALAELARFSQRAEVDQALLRVAETTTKPLVRGDAIRALSLESERARNVVRRGLAAAPHPADPFHYVRESSARAAERMGLGASDLEMPSLEVADRHASEKRWSEAIAVYTSIIEAAEPWSKEQKTARVRRARCYFQSGDAAAALKGLVDGDDPLLRAKCLVQQGNPDAALEALRHFDAVGPPKKEAESLFADIMRKRTLSSRRGH